MENEQQDSAQTSADGAAAPEPQQHDTPAPVAEEAPAAKTAAPDPEPVPAEAAAEEPAAVDEPAPAEVDTSRKHANVILAVEQLARDAEKAQAWGKHVRLLNLAGAMAILAGRMRELEAGDVEPESDVGHFVHDVSRVFELEIRTESPA